MANPVGGASSAKSPVVSATSDEDRLGFELGGDKGASDAADAALGNTPPDGPLDALSTASSGGARTSTAGATVGSGRSPGGPAAGNREGEVLDAAEGGAVRPPQGLRDNSRDPPRNDGAA